ncbi:MAG: hypothetical protein HQ488_04840 [Parcubacteria group bacterium]|nr:hypothetical protein [Parcubacteria group bacterium]
MTDSVSCLLIDLEGDRVLLISQMHLTQMRDDNPTGVEIETVAGRFDVDLGPKALAVKEASEEAGAAMTEDAVVVLNGGRSMSLSAGILTERAFLSVARIDTAKVTGPDTGLGNPNEGEDISRLWMPISVFCDPTTIHDGVRTFAFAQWLRAERLKQQLAEAKRPQAASAGDRNSNKSYEMT